MSGIEPAKTANLSVAIRDQKCTGCVVCMKACPTKAVRIKSGKAVILPDLCVECGECIRVCPQRAVAPRVSTYKDMARFKVTALLPSRVLYTQFGEDVMPNDILLALSKMGFDYVFDGAYYCEWVTLATNDWLHQH
ncbi:MAG: 4Fe-4S dicluster domain-containing protein, partial [Thermodesulfobacteriota bacterium]